MLDWPVFLRVFVVLWAFALVGCASSPPAKSTGTSKPIDLQPARAAVQKARDAGAAEKAPQDFSRAEGHLKAAEAAAQRDQGDEASCLTEMATYEAECARRLTAVGVDAERLSAAQKEAADAEQLAARLKKSEEEQHRLEERVAVLLRDLDLTETEVIRAKAKLQGLETKADATSVIAETRVLFRRGLQQRGRTPSLVRCEELLNRAEAMVDENNHGAAVFMALKAQELLKDTRRTATAPEPERSATKKEYVVVADVANLRREPSRTAPVVRQLKKGAVVEASQTRGDWLQVKADDATGWIARALVE